MVSVLWAARAWRWRGGLEEQELFLWEHGPGQVQVSKDDLAAASWQC